MISPEPEFFVVMVLPCSVDDQGFRVEAVFTTEADAIAHAELLEKSNNYWHVGRPQKEMMSSLLDRLLHQKIRCLASAGAEEIVLKIKGD